MLARASLALVALTCPALADPLTAHAALDEDETGIASEVSLGGGGDSTQATYSIARLALSTGLARPSAPIQERGLHFCSLDEGGCGWIFTGLDPDAVDGIYAHAEGELLVPNARAVATGGISAQLAGWHLGVQASVQPVAGLRAPIWRSGRGLVEGRTEIEIPGMWSIGTYDTQFVPMTFQIGFARRVAYEDGTKRNAGFDRDIAMIGARFYTSRLRLDVLDIGLHDYGLETATLPGASGPVTYGNSATLLELTVADATVHIGHGVSARGVAGVNMLMPVAPFKRVGTSESSTGPSENAPNFTGELTYASDAGSVTVGGGTWSRLDPTGHAVDVGHLGTASFVHDAGRWALRGELGLGKLRRELLGDMAPADIAPVGTRMWMGRAALSASIDVGHDVAIAATAWAERSDRDDPRSLPREPGDITTRAGADVSAAWRFTRKRDRRR